MQTSLPVLKGLPLIGNLFAAMHDLGNLLDSATTLGPVAKVILPGCAMYVLSHHASVREALVGQADLLKSDLNGTKLLELLPGMAAFIMEQERQRTCGAMTTTAFRQRKLASYAHCIVQAIEETTSQWQDGQTIDLSAALARLTRTAAARALLGFDDTDVLVNRVVKDLIEPIDRPAGQSRRSPFSSDHGKTRRPPMDESIRRNMDAVIVERVRNPTDDLLTTLLTSDVGNGQPIGHETIRDEIIPSHMAEQGMIAETLAWAVEALGRSAFANHALSVEAQTLWNPVEPTASLKSMVALAAIAKETLRLHPPVWLLAYQTTRTLHIGRGDLPAGTFLTVNVHGLHRQPDAYPDPDAFRHERWTVEFETFLPECAYLPFGWNERADGGRDLTSIVLRVALACLWASHDLEVISGHGNAIERLVMPRQSPLIVRARRRPALK